MWRNSHSADIGRMFVCNVNERNPVTYRSLIHSEDQVHVITYTKHSQILIQEYAANLCKLLTL